MCSFTRVCAYIVAVLLLSTLKSTHGEEQVIPRKIESRIVEFPRKVDSGGAFVVIVEIKNNSDLSVVVPRFLSVFDMKITDRGGKEVPCVEEFLDIEFAPSDVNSFMVVEPGQTAKIEAATPANITENAGGHGVSLNWLFFTNDLKPGMYNLSYDVLVRGNMDVKSGGKLRTVKEVFPNANCDIEFRTAPVIVLVNGKT